MRSRSLVALASSKDLAWQYHKIILILNIVTVHNYAVCNMVTEVLHLRTWTLMSTSFCVCTSSLSASSFSTGDGGGVSGPSCGGKKQQNSEHHAARNRICASAVIPYKFLSTKIGSGGIIKGSILYCVCSVKQHAETLCSLLQAPYQPKLLLLLFMSKVPINSVCYETTHWKAEAIA